MLFKRLPLAIFRRFASSSSSSINSVVAEKLSNRGLLRIEGEEVPGFIQGLITADVAEFVSNPDARSVYSHILNVKGRVMYDLFVYKDPTCEKSGESLLVEADSEALARLAALVKMYRVKRKISIEKTDEFAVWNVHATSAEQDLELEGSERSVIARDPRLPLLGWRLLVPSNEEKPVSNLENMRIIESDDSYCYRRLRYELGVPEGTSEIPPGNCTPLEYNLDILNGVSFQKGCYIGQELTARTKHTGVVRKRIMPLKMSPEAYENEAAYVGSTVLNASGKNVGKIIGALPQFHLALGLMRFTLALQAPDELRLPTSDNLRLTVVKPSWWPDFVTEIQDGPLANVKKDGGVPEDTIMVGRTA